ncbi:hypothetical protein EB1_06720 [Empedobacter brevis NBRC 14943 = ATCC 43319]|uniref:Polysaccharide biosynthesis protein n=1 Tax=Empedobacter brevis NBRC 14943 = ATCC 43319 TaxID=1218108 RepID=A0A511NDJ4_9FLAO|nr:hypothetical protein EB1_06720 [Empedobacter brevis NBRC 14943 = ATCC 43319]
MLNIILVNDLIVFLKDFYKNKGHMVFSSIMIEKIIALINMIFVVRMISDEDYGSITLIASIFGVFITLNGFGTIQGLMRYGSLLESTQEKNNLSSYIFRLGLQKQLLLTFLFCFVALFYEFKYQTIWMVICFFAGRMLGSYFYSFIQSYYRIHGMNEKFSFISIVINSLGLVVSILLTFFYGKYGYLFGLAITPWFCLFYYKKEILRSMNSTFQNFNLREFWNYSMNSSITYFFSELLFMIDIFMIGLLLNETAVANYKVAIILPMNLMFIPMIFIQTDLPKIISNSKNKSYLKFYISNYYKLFIPISIVIIVLGFLLKDVALPFVFGEEYQGNGWIFFIILFAVCCNMCFRNLYGNLLSAVGLAGKNSIVSIASIILMTGLSILLIPKLNTLGAAISLAITFVTMGIVSSIIFRRYLIHLNN